MSPFTVLLVVAHACLIQSVFCCGCGYAPAAPIVAPLAGPGIYPAGAIGLGAGLGYGAGLGLGYGAGPASTWVGQGCAEVSAAGDLGVAGNTLVVGKTPVLGQVGFTCAVPATGAVTISGNCGYPCGCNGGVSGIYY